jgi:hypothetical protein
MPLNLILHLIIRFHNRERRNNNEVYRLNYMNKKGHCKNCGDQIGDDSNSNEFCSEQCGVEYQLEHK